MYEVFGQKQTGLFLHYTATQKVLWYIVDMIISRNLFVYFLTLPSLHLPSILFTFYTRYRSIYLLLG